MSEVIIPVGVGGTFPSFTAGYTYLETTPPVADVVRFRAISNTTEVGAIGANGINYGTSRVIFDGNGYVQEFTTGYPWQIRPAAFTLTFDHIVENCNILVTGGYNTDAIIVGSNGQALTTNQFIIRDCTARNSGGGGATRFFSFNSKGVDLRAYNIRVTGFTWGMLGGVADIASPIVGVKAFEDITIHQCAYGFYIQDIGGEPIDLIRNVGCYDCSTADFYSVGSVTTFENCRDSDGTLVTLGTCSNDGTVVPADEFVSTTYGDADYLRPTTSGTIASAGTAPTYAGDTDLDGNPRPSRLGYAIGAYEALVASTPYDHLVVDAGAVYLNYGESSETLLGATRGGSTFAVDTELVDMPADGEMGDVKGGVRIDVVTATLTTHFVEMSADLISRVLPGSLAADYGSPKTHDEITRVLEEIIAEYADNIALVGQVHGSDNPIELILDNALVDGNFEVVTDDNDEAVLTAKFTAHFEPSDMDTEPYLIRTPVLT